MCVITLGMCGAGSGSGNRMKQGEGEYTETGLGIGMTTEAVSCNILTSVLRLEVCSFDVNRSSVPIETTFFK